MQRLPALNFPTYSFKLKEEAEKPFIFDAIRKKWLVLTPEEWVRQHMIAYLIQEKKYPKSLIQLEGGLKVNTLQKRSDILIYDSYGKPLLLVECKADTVKVTQDVFEQIAAYNTQLQVRYLVVSNGLHHYCCEMDYTSKSYRFLAEIPVFN